MSTGAYHDVLKQAQRLTSADQLRLLEELAGILRRQDVGRKRRSILELQGLGKGVWRDIDPEEYVDRERDSWNG
ncbi:MAG: hypothetical protein JXA93_15355 [Anaerolineae bacterium]|nr:hypothetical protein [Anaerolineae bacterium]